MFPTRINVISPDKRKRIERIVHVQFFRTLIQMGLIIASIAGIVLVGGEIILDEYFEGIIEINNINTQQKQGETNKQIGKINNTLKNTRALQSVYTQWSDVIVTLASSTPSGIVFSDILLDTNTKKYTFSGFAFTRDDLLAVKEQLETIPEIETVTIPLAHLTEQTNILFTITADLK
ncbi:MAG: hypothetical protein HOE80_04275 [Candidatus Magasanikbacteria bacterium]|nr:hypothetical protein [Candidatus Magasanikbacteria bacterium]MBT4071910.1 hypothetical protein [Candidatus Magasanikbacteria bacterium]